MRVVVGEDGEPRFVAKDVATVLGYKDPDQAIRKHCKYPQKMTPSKQRGQKGGAQFVTIIPESDVYRLIMRSKMPQAEEIQDWVSSDILPTIRKYDIYATSRRH